MIDLYEATRNELINKSKNADKVKSYGTTRYDRKDKQHIIDPTRALNKIDMNALFRADMLSFKIPVQGETDKYEVEVLFENVCNDFKREIKNNDNKLEYKCFYRALIDAINRQDIYVACDCKDFIYRFQYWATKNGYNGGRPETRLADITNPGDTKGAGCKHLMRVLANLDWMVKLATAIFNYVCYMEENYTGKFANIIFPALFDIPYEDYKGDTSVYVTGDDELADTMTDDEDQDIIDTANEREPEETGEESTETEPMELPDEEPEEEEESEVEEPKKDKDTLRGIWQNLGKRG